MGDRSRRTCRLVLLEREWYHLGDAHGTLEHDDLHHLGEQLGRFGQRDIQSDRRGSGPDGACVRGPQPEPHEQHGHGPLHADALGSGEITGWAIEPSLPAGLEFGTSNGTVWGTPTEILNRTEFTIWANNSGGSVNVTFNLTVEDQIPTDLTYADLNLSLTNNTAMVPSTPTLTGPGDITGWAIAPSLPAGLEFGTSNGTVWGTPTEILNRTEFTIWANNSGGSVNVTFNLTVVDQILACSPWRMSKVATTPPSRP